MPDILALLATVSVLMVVPPAIVNPVRLLVSCRPLKLLFVNASAPDNVAKVPLIGRETLVVPIVFKVKAFDPLVVKLPPKVMVLPVLFTPVPPFAPEIVPVTLSSETEPEASFALLIAPFEMIGFVAVELGPPRSPAN